MNGIRVWVFRILIVIAVGLLIYSWLLPWWQAYIQMLDRYVIIRPWGLDITDLVEAGMDHWVKGAPMPAFFAPIMWCYAGLCVLALLFSLFIKNKEIKVLKIKTTLPQLLIGLVGISYIVVVITAVIFANIRLKDFYGVPLIGTFYLDLEYPMQTFIFSKLLFGYWLSCFVGPFCVALACLRNKITGRKSTT